MYSPKNHLSLLLHLKFGLKGLLLSYYLGLIQAGFLTSQPNRQSLLRNNAVTVQVTGFNAAFLSPLKVTMNNNKNSNINYNYKYHCYNVNGNCISNRNSNRNAYRNGETIKVRKEEQDSSHHRDPEQNLNTNIKMEREDNNFLQLEEYFAKSRADFPILNEIVHQDKELIYLDSGASSQRPSVVLEAMNDYYLTSHSNVHRGAHFLAGRATEKYESARDTVKDFIQATLREEIIFTRGATEAINLVAYSWGMKNLKKGDIIVTSIMEHHANLVPWQLVCSKIGCEMKYVDIISDTNHNLDMKAYENLMQENAGKVKLVAMPHVSNTLGCILPAKDIINIAHSHGALVLLDGCQATPHLPLNVKDLDVDFYVASGHKMCGPTGSGFLYAKYEILDEQMDPFHGGGEMIDEVFMDHSTFAKPPSKFEAGTPGIAEAVGLAAAINYLQELGMDKIHSYDMELGAYLYQQLKENFGDDLELYGPNPEIHSSVSDEDNSNKTSAPERSSLVAFNHKRIHASDLAFFLDMEGVAIRAGHHCTQPLHRRFGAKGSARASLYFYNTKKDIDQFITKMKHVVCFLEGDDNVEGLNGMEEDVPSLLL